MSTGQFDHVIGNTPLYRLGRLSPRPDVEVYGKLEGNNLGGSVKDRAALSMFEAAEAEGHLQGRKVVEPTSGNTGIALAMIAGLKGVDITLLMPEGSTPERVATMRAYGAKVVLTPQSESMEGAIDRARAMVATGEYLMLDQFSNPANPLAHFKHTGPEIWRDTGGRVTHFVSSMGTTGTIMGTSRFLKSQNPEVVICGVQPAENAKIPGIRRWPQAYMPKIYEPERVDRIIDVTEIDARDTTRALAQHEGLFVGLSAGGAGWAALQVAAEAPSGSVIVFICCDRGDKYLSVEGLFG
ncbi:MAG: cysteine synthase CysM [Bradymonadia bacterium]|jgi:cysteine synthase B